MGLAVPSVAEASRGLPSVKADNPLVDEKIVTSVAFISDGDAEPVSPELALVDPLLAERLRASMVEAEPIELEPVLEHEASNVTEWSATTAVAEEPDPSAANVHVLRLAPVAVSSDEVRDHEPASASAVAAPAIPRTVVSETARSGGSALGRTLAAFGAGAVVATLVVVGVIAELGESDTPTKPGASTAADGAGPSLAPPAVASPARSGANAPSKPAKVKKPSATSKSKSTSTASKKSDRRSTRKQSPTAAKSKPAARAPAASRRFAWAPVDSAVGYRVELFRGNKQVLRATTKQPVFELATQWRHQGRTERLSPGAYRWYVWPVFQTGPATQAVVQARLEIP